MWTESRRRFNIVDGLIVTAATAGTLALLRDALESPWVDRPPGTDAWRIVARLRSSEQHTHPILGRLRHSVRLPPLAHRAFLPRRLLRDDRRGHESIFYNDPTPS
jgi:hypothetical protein